MWKIRATLRIRVRLGKRICQGVGCMRPPC